jgi:hypothetical protein
MPMTEAEWLACTWPTLMLNFVNLKMSDRRKRLFAVACCRLIIHLLPDEHHRNAIKVAEDVADGLASDEQRLATADAAYDGEAYPAAHAALAEIAYEAADKSCFYAVCTVEAEVNRERGLIELAHQALALRDIFGNPFRPSPPLPPAVLAWHDRTIPRLAEVIYEVRQLPAGTLDTARLAILADALLDAGCEDEELIAHCRSEGPHIRGCWAIDAILGKS